MNDATDGFIQQNPTRNIHTFWKPFERTDIYQLNLPLNGVSQRRNSLSSKFSASFKTVLNSSASRNTSYLLGMFLGHVTCGSSCYSFPFAQPNTENATNVSKSMRIIFIRADFYSVKLLSSFSLLVHQYQTNLIVMQRHEQLELTTKTEKCLILELFRTQKKFQGARTLIVGIENVKLFTQWF